MANEPVNCAFATAAAKTFVARNPGYVVSKKNSPIMARELIRLVEQEGAEPASVDTYVRAFQNCLQELEIREPEPRKSVEEMWPEELAALSPAEQERLPDHILRKLANYELTKRRQKPTLDEHSATLIKSYIGLCRAASTKSTNEASSISVAM